jgi:flavin-dependent dehydrogenase
MQEMFDVIVVGASLAGASAAIRLGQAGLKVALVDKASFPRRKPCGEGLSSYGLAQLATLGLKDRVLKLPHLPYLGYQIKTGESRAFIKSPWAGSITIQRIFLDTELVRAALECPNITPLLSRPVTEITQNSITLESRKLTAKRVVLACGSNSRLLQTIPCVLKRSGPSRSGVSAIFKGEFQQLPRFINILLKKKYELFCTPLADGYLNVSVLTPTASSLNIREVLSSDKVLHEVFAECFFKGTLEFAPQGRAKIGNVSRSCLLPGVLLAGDAKEEFDPIGGMGMSHALSSGIHVAETILKELARSAPSVLFEKRPTSTRAMRRFTTLSYTTLRGAKHFPIILPMVASPVGLKVLKFLTRELA